MQLDDLDTILSEISPDKIGKLKGLLSKLGGKLDINLTTTSWTDLLKSLLSNPKGISLIVLGLGFLFDSWHKSKVETFNNLIEARKLKLIELGEDPNFIGPFPEDIEKQLPKLPVFPVEMKLDFFPFTVEFLGQVFIPKEFGELPLSQTLILAGLWGLVDIGEILKGIGEIIPG